MTCCSQVSRDPKAADTGAFQPLVALPAMLCICFFILLLIMYSVYSLFILYINQINKVTDIVKNGRSLIDMLVSKKFTDCFNFVTS